MSRAGPRGELLRCVAIAGGIALLAAAPAAQAYTRHFEAHCQVADGSKLILRAAYEYTPLAMFRNARVSMVGDWEVRYQSGPGARHSAAAPYPVHFSDADQVDCHRVGKLDGVVVANASFLRSDGSWFQPEGLPRHLNLTNVAVEWPAAVRAELKALGADPLDRFALIAMHGARLVYEQPMLSFASSPQGHVVAVYQSSSDDNGATWSSPVVTRQSRHFELAKTLAEQRYAARLVPGGTVGQRR